MSTTETSSAGLLPPDDPQRTLLHNEVHARPPARIRLPALVSYVAVFHEGLTREQECEHLRRLPGQEALRVEDLHDNFLRIREAGYTLKWERHTEFTRYSLVQPLPDGMGLDACEPSLAGAIATPVSTIAPMAMPPPPAASVPPPSQARVALSATAPDSPEIAAPVLAVASELRSIANALADLQGVLERSPARCDPPGESTPA